MDVKAKILKVKQLTTRLYELLSTASGTDASSANTTNLKLATTELNKLYKSQPVLSPLLEIALSTSPEGIRQLAAVEARKRIEKPKVKVWQKTAPPQRTLIKVSLLRFCNILFNLKVML